MPHDSTPDHTHLIIRASPDYTHLHHLHGLFAMTSLDLLGAPVFSVRAGAPWVAPPWAAPWVGHCLVCAMYARSTDM